MPYTGDHKEMSKDLVSEMHGKQEASVSKTTKTHNHKDKALGKLPLIPLQLRNRGTVNQSPWILIG